MPQYPLGTFLEDYVYNSETTSFAGGRLNSELQQRLQTEGNDYILQQFEPGIVLGEENGRVMNTLSSLRIFILVVCSVTSPRLLVCHHTSLTSLEVRFKNRPISQNVVFKNNGDTVSTDKTQTVDDKTITFDLEMLNRHRSVGMSNTGEGVNVEIGDITSGSVSEIYIEDGSPDTTVVGDILRFDNTNTKGGGAEGKVTHVEGVDVSKGFGQEIVTRVLSHRQRINLRFNNTAYTFSKDSTIRTSSGAEAVIDSYDSRLRFLDVTTTTENLIKFGDTFTDNKGRTVTIPSSQDGNDAIMFDAIAGAGSTFISYSQPEPRRHNLVTSGGPLRLVVCSFISTTVTPVSGSPHNQVV